METCERCGEESELISDDLVCMDCVELQVDFLYDRMKEERW